MDQYLNHNNKFFFYNKNTVPSLFLSKYNYKNGFSVFQLKGLNVYSRLRFIAKPNQAKDIFILTNFLLLILFKLKVRCYFFLSSTKSSLRVRNFLFLSFYPVKLVYKFFRYLKKLTRRIHDVYGFFFKVNYNQVVFKFVYKESTPQLIFYYSLKYLRTHPNIKYVEDLFFFVNKFFFVFVLLFSEVSFREKYFFYFRLLRAPFFFKEYEQDGLF